MASVLTTLDGIRRQIAPDDEILRETRSRRDLVLSNAADFHGVRGTFDSGSLAHGTANDPVFDADCGVILDRRSYPALGPDGENDGPAEILEDLRTHVRDAVKEAFPAARFSVTKRAIKVVFNETVGGQDPSVDLIVSLDRKGAPGLWIPNTEHDRWDASHPAEHTRLILAPNAKTGSVFARAIRLVKAWNRQYSQPGLCSFNIEALALACITDVTSLTIAVGTLFGYAATDLKRHLTPDPAAVSGPIKLLLDKDVVVKRLDTASDRYSKAVAADTEAEMLTHLSVVFYRFVDPPESEAKESIAAQLRRGNVVAAGAFGIQVAKPTRAFGRS